METDINYWAVLGAALASMVVGFIWYGVLFKKQYTSLLGFTPESMRGMKMTANKAYFLQFIASLVVASVLAKFVGLGLLDDTATSRLSVGVNIGFWAWLGLVVPVSLGIVLWEGKSWKLWFINASSYLVTLLAMGIILGLWV